MHRIKGPTVRPQYGDLDRWMTRRRNIVPAPSSALHWHNGSRFHAALLYPITFGFFDRCSVSIVSVVVVTAGLKSRGRVLYSESNASRWRFSRQTELEMGHDTGSWHASHRRWNVLVFSYSVLENEDTCSAHKETYD